MNTLLFLDIHAVLTGLVGFALDHWPCRLEERRVPIGLSEVPVMRFSREWSDDSGMSTYRLLQAAEVARLLLDWWEVVEMVLHLIVSWFGR